MMSFSFVMVSSTCREPVEPRTVEPRTNYRKPKVSFDRLRMTKNWGSDDIFGAQDDIFGAQMTYLGLR